MNRAVFLDRDGVINNLVHYEGAEIVDSPFTPGLLTLLPRVGESIKLLNDAGFKVVLVSNQPGVAKGHFTEKTLREMTARMVDAVAIKKARFDGIYYCIHHPQGTVRRYTVSCDCRKPKPGLLLKAAAELDIDLSQSYMVGDSITDIQAGQAAGCSTILIGRLKCETCRLIDEQAARPDHFAPDIWEAVHLIINRKQARKNSEKAPAKRKAVRGNICPVNEA